MDFYEIKDTPTWQAGTPVLLEHLTKYSQWPSRLIGLESWKPPRRNKKEALREYEKETYLPQRSFLEQDTTIKDYGKLFAYLYPHILNQCCVRNNELRLLSPADAFQICIDWVTKIIQQFLPASAIVELGAGNGRNIVSLKKRFPNIDMYGFDLMPSAKAVMNIMAKRSSVSVRAGHCDFLSKYIVKSNIPPNAILLTVFSTYYVHFDYIKWMQALKRLHPKFIIHVEPVFSSFDSSLLGLLQKKYMLINKYNTTYFEQLENDTNITICHKENQVFGTNPLIPITPVVWKFK